MIEKAVLIYNPASGRRPMRRAAQVETAATVLRAAGVEAVTVATRGPGTAGEQARQAIRAGFDTVLACGGDGTVHEVLQGMIGSEAALGVVPMGTANALACDLRIPRNPAMAARAALSAQPVRVALGKISSRARMSKAKKGRASAPAMLPSAAAGETISRYFLVAAGIGPDAHFAYKIAAESKWRMGYLAYIAHAWLTWATHHYSPFEVEFLPAEGGARREVVSQVLAVRIAEFGGVLRRLAPGASLGSNSLRLVLFKTPRRIRYLQYMTNVLLGRSRPVPEVELINASSVQCRPLLQPASDPVWRRGCQQPIYAEADGELLGTLPAQIAIVPEALTILVPNRQSSGFTAAAWRRAWHNLCRE